MTWVYVITGVVCLIALQSIRSALSLVFPVRVARAGTPPDARQFGGLELIDETTAALEYLGFSGPAWLCDDESQTEQERTNYHAVYRNVDKNTVAWVSPVGDVTQPDQLLCYYTTALNDGRFVVTQVSDPFFAAVGDTMTPAQTIAATDKASELQQHLEFVAQHDSSPIPNVPVRDAVMKFMGEHQTAIRQRLLERGKARESDGIARPSFLFALRILRHFFTRPVRKSSETREIPSARLAYLVAVAKRASHNAPSQGMQWFLLILSAVLFVGIGTPLLGIEYTLIILGVILFHEGGHWAAMKAFGYRNPHITLLPLLGGVTIGHETDPGAVKRAWVSLAGPLPGIILGWGILYYAMLVTVDTIWLTEWLFPIAIALLFVNYLNVLPIPPLDGAHVLTALLPPRWIYVQAIVVILGVVLGIYAAFLLEFMPLALISAMQLFALKNIRVNAKLVNQFRREGVPEATDENARMEWLLKRLDELLGPPKKAAKRIAMATAIEGQIDMRPMGAGHRTFASVVYGGLLIVPLAVITFALLDPLGWQPSEEAVAAWDEIEQQEIDYHDELRAKPLAELVVLAAGTDDFPEPATEAQLNDAAVRLGQPLPDHLRRFYEIANGLPEAGVGPIEEIKRVDPALFTEGDLMYTAYEGELYFYADSVEENWDEIVLPVETAYSWWQIGRDEEYGGYIFADPAAAPGARAIYLSAVDENSVHVDIKTVLVDRLVVDKMELLYAEHEDQRMQRNIKRTENMEIESLLEEFPTHGLLAQLFFDTPELPPPAPAAAIREAEQRIGYALPADHRDALALHNGFGDVFPLLPTDEILPASTVAVDSLTFILDQMNTGDESQAELTLQELQQCLVVAGFRHEDIETGDNTLYGHVYWCPELDDSHRYVSPIYGGYHDSLTSVIRTAVARVSVDW